MKKPEVIKELVRLGKGTTSELNTSSKYLLNKKTGDARPGLKEMLIAAYKEEATAAP